MKKTLFTIITTLFLFPISTSATTTQAWVSSTTPPVSFIIPNIINGVDPAIKVFGRATSTINKLEVDQLNVISGASLPVSPVLTGFTTGSTLFVGVGSTIAQDNTNYFWDDTNNRLGIGSSSPSAKLSIKGVGAGTGRAFVISDSNNVERVTIQDIGRIGLGQTVPTRAIDIVGSTNPGSTISMTGYAIGPRWETRRINGTVASPTATLDTERIGMFSWLGYDGSLSGTSAQIEIRQNGNVAGSGTQIVPALMALRTTSASGSGEPNDNIVIRNDGLVGIGLPTSGASNIITDVNSIQALLHLSTTTPGMDVFRADAGSATLRFDKNGSLGIGSTTPWAQLSVNPNALGSGVPEFVIGSSTATHLLVNGTGNVGIGGTTIYAKLSAVDGVPENTNVPWPTNAARSAFFAGHISTNSLGSSGARFQNEGQTGTGVNANIVGITAQGVTSPNLAGNVNSISGLFTATSHTGAGRVTDMFGLDMSVDASTGSGGADNMYSIMARNPSVGSGVTVTNRYGAYLEGGTFTGTVTNNYGLYIDSQPGGTNRFALYQEGASDPNYFAGKVGVASTTPWGLLSVNPNDLGSGVPEFVVGSSTATHFIVNGAGNVGIGTTSPYAKLSIQSGASTGDAFVVATSTRAAVFGIDNDGHQFTSGPAGVVSLCGTGTGTVVGDDISGTITTATAATSCTYTFAKAYRNTPTCRITDDSLVGFADVASVSTTAVTFGISSALTGGKLYYSCSYHQ